MTDPYKILGVSQNATDDELKAAYRDLAKKYHPDSYTNNPLADLALEKMKEINEAYDMAVKTRQGGGNSQGSSYQSGNNDGYARSNFKSIRDMISANRIAEAQTMLDNIHASERIAEWYFLKGSVFYKSNWMNEAYNYFQTAYNKDPSNPEYREAFAHIQNQMNGQGFGGANEYNQGKQQGCSGCDICSGLMCADCLCSSCGGC
jgi:molecular chaperone DnaJ